MQNIKMLDFISKISDAFFMAHNTLKNLSLRESQELMISDMMYGLDDLLQELEDNKTILINDPQKINEFKNNIKQSLHNMNLSKIKKYPLILLNQSLVMLCTIMEIFFIHILESIIDAAPKTLLGLANKKEITLEKVLDLKDYKLIIEDFKNKTIEDFSRQGLGKKFRIFKILGIDTDKIFDYSKLKKIAQERLKNHDFKKLDEIFNKRHDIVHQNKLPLNNLDELSSIKDFFDKIIVNFSLIVYDKYNIPLDIMIKKQTS